MDIFRTPLGEMEIIEYYLYYDRPFIFLCEDNIKNRFLVHLVDDDEMCERWFLVPVSTRRTEAIRTGKITLRESLILAETGWIWDITTPFDDTEGNVVILKCSELTEDYLPGATAKLSLPENRLPEKNFSAEEEAYQLNRDVLLLYLNDGEHSQLISAEDLGGILLKSQGLLHALVDREGSNKGRIPQVLKDKATMYYTGTFAASVGIKLEAKNNELFDNPIQVALESLIQLIDNSKNKEQLMEMLSTLTMRAIVRYRDFLQALQKSNISIKIEWGTPQKSVKKAFLNIEQIKYAIDVMVLNGQSESQIIHLRGNLVGLLSDSENSRYTFEFKTLDGERYKGTLAQEMIDKLKSGQTVNIPANNVSIELEEAMEINPATSEERFSYTLISIG
ncbi:MAG: DUF6575 domain-containing protein [Bacilli bacterium]